jgi:hypothetical protein
LGLVLIWILHEIKNTNLAGPHQNQSSKSVQIHPNLSTVYYPNTFSISTEAMLKLLTDEFSKNNPEDGRYTPQQHRQDSESSPATTGEFNCMLNAAVNKVHQPQADKETSSAYVRCRAAQEQLSQSLPTLREHVKTEPVTPPMVDNDYACAQWWQKEFHNHINVQCYWLAEIQASGTLWLPDQNIIFHQTGMLQDRNDWNLRHDPTHNPSEQGSPPQEYHHGPDGGDGGSGSNPLSHGDD